MSFYVYILLCADRSYYTGHTDNLERRLTAHSSGDVAGYTRNRLPVRLVFAEAFESRIEALELERQIKGWSRAKKKALVERNWDLLIDLANKSGSTGSPRTGDGAP